MEEHPDAIRFARARGKADRATKHHARMEIQAVSGDPDLRVSWDPEEAPRSQDVCAQGLRLVNHKPGIVADHRNDPAGAAGFLSK
jgi:hypothetical protein